MEQNNQHEVYFHEYCPKCKWKDAPDKPDPKIPCDECLEVPFREASHIPEYYDGPLPGGEEKK